jgi:hypothetical protein
MVLNSIFGRKISKYTGELEKSDSGGIVPDFIHEMIPYV